MIDTHCHLNMVLDKDNNIDYDKLNNILNQMKENGVENAITIGSNIEDSKFNVELANKYDNIYCAVGVHPEDVESFDLNLLEELVKDNVNNKLVAIGEIGLDYYWRKDNKEEQIKVFEAQIELAKKYGLPIVVHCREAYGDCLDILQKHAPYNSGGVIHCYSGSIEWAREIVALGLIISFTGVVTYNNAKNVQEVAKWIDNDLFMVETDSPYLTPVPYRGQENNPSLVKYVAKYIAELKNINYEEIDKITTKNAKKLFKIK